MNTDEGLALALWKNLRLVQIGSLKTTCSNPLDCQPKQWSSEKEGSLLDISQIISSRVSHSNLWLSRSMFLVHTHCSSCLIIWQMFHFSIPRSSIIPYSSTENTTCSIHTNWSLICLHCTFPIHCSLVNPKSITRPQKSIIISAQSSLFMCLPCPLSIIHLPLGSSTEKDSEKVSLWLKSH